MKLRIKSLGPISEESEIELGDLTVFFGPPNSGKSTVLRAIYYSLNTFGWELLSSKKPGYGLLNISYEIVDEKTVKLIFTPSDLFIRQSLPEGDFTFEPFSFIDFIKTHKVYERGIKGNVKFTSIVSPSECDEKVIKRLGEIGVNFEAEIIGNKGYARILTAIEGISESCRDYLYHVIAEGIVEEIGKRIYSKLELEFWKEMSKRESISNVLLIPYNRSLVAYEVVNIISRISQSTNNLLVLSDEFEEALRKSAWVAGSLLDVIELLFFYFRVLQSSSLLKRFGEGDKIYRILKPLIPGNVKLSENGELYYIEKKVIPWRFVSASIMEVISLLLTLREREIVLYEEPESQFHEKLQILMGLILYALTTTNKLVITTHSQTILYTLAFLSFLKPTSEEIIKLLDSLEIKNDELVENILEANKKIVRFYYFHDGRVEEISDETITKGIPSFVDVLDKELKWFSEIYLSRLRKGAVSKE
ncbi:AAA family ATPase [Sulfurisphaera tokodaii]|uniref:Endonuclease GajA/Old nuclease/RecF-like AAA domain-containing protein n=2 Tax=Sulfurisphaera tokodaii TaxID=111955 RepID=Q972D9_SULTO|nr:AAA family ATPase [Sulfurisphaera tokodaii]BAB66230.1 hypothetical protein STK_11890 [Sulfurisphaera tokodaii str. 7]HII73206.1 ATP-binding protein [Sulfurisphaera tokodaii]